MKEMLFYGHVELSPVSLETKQIQHLELLRTECILDKQFIEGCAKRKVMTASPSSMGKRDEAKHEFRVLPSNNSGFHILQSLLTWFSAALLVTPVDPLKAALRRVGDACAGT